MPHFAAVLWGVILPIIMALIIGIILFLIGRAVLDHVRGRSAGNDRTPDRSGKDRQMDPNRDSAGGRDGRNGATDGRKGAADPKNGRKRPKEGFRRWKKWTEGSQRWEEGSQ